MKNEQEKESRGSLLKRIQAKMKEIKKEEKEATGRLFECSETRMK